MQSDETRTGASAFPMRRYRIKVVNFGSGSTEVVASGTHEKLNSQTPEGYQQMQERQRRYAKIARGSQKQRARIYHKSFVDQGRCDEYIFVVRTTGNFVLAHLVLALPGQHVGAIEMALNLLMPSRSNSEDDIKEFIKNGWYPKVLPVLVVSVATGTNDTRYLENAIKYRLPFFGVEHSVHIAKGGPTEGTEISLARFICMSNDSNLGYSNEFYMSTIIAKVAESLPPASNTNNLLRTWFETCIPAVDYVSTEDITNVLVELIREVGSPSWYVKRVLWKSYVMITLEDNSFKVASLICREVQDNLGSWAYDIIDALVDCIGFNPGCLEHLAEANHLQEAGVYYLKAAAKAGPDHVACIATNLFGDIESLSGFYAGKKEDCVNAILDADLTGLIDLLEPTSITDDLIGRVDRLTAIIRNCSAEFKPEYYGQSNPYQRRMFLIANAIIRKCPDDMHSVLRQYDAYTAIREMPKLSAHNANEHPEVFRAIMCFMYCAARSTGAYTPLSHDVAYHIARIVWQNAYVLV